MSKVKRKTSENPQFIQKSRAGRMCSDSHIAPRGWAVWERDKSYGGGGERGHKYEELPHPDAVCYVGSLRA